MRRQLITLSCVVFLLFVMSSIILAGGNHEKVAAKNQDEVTITDDDGNPLIVFRGTDLRQVTFRDHGTVRGRVSEVVVNGIANQPQILRSMMNNSAVFGYAAGDNALILDQRSDAPPTVSAAGDFSSMTVNMAPLNSSSGVQQTMSGGIHFDKTCSDCEWCRPCQADWVWWTCHWSGGGSCTHCVTQPC